MDTPITEKALFAQTRVQQALEAGAHCIDADDVREALDGFKGALDCQFGVHNDLLERINGLETQLFHCRVNAGGSEALLSGAISIRDRLVDYFRYVEESVPFAKTAEARERGTAIVDGMNWLIREAGNSRLAVQAVKAQRNQLEAELAEARMALDASHGLAGICQNGQREIRLTLSSATGRFSSPCLRNRSAGTTWRWMAMWFFGGYRRKRVSAARSAGDSPEVVVHARHAPRSK